MVVSLSRWRQFNWFWFVCLDVFVCFLVFRLNVLYDVPDLTYNRKFFFFFWHLLIIFDAGRNRVGRERVWEEETTTTTTTTKKKIVDSWQEGRHVSNLICRPRRLSFIKKILCHFIFIVVVLVVVVVVCIGTFLVVLIINKFFYFIFFLLLIQWVVVL